MTRDIKVKLSVDGRQLKQGMNKAANSVTDFSEKTKQMSINVAKAGAAVAVAVAAIGASVLKMASEAAAAGVEIKNLSAQAGISTTDFQKMAAATRTVGFEQEKLSDILKDVNDKFGDYMATGAGPLADFFEQIAPKIGVTAEQFAKLSGPDALQLYVSSLEQAGLSQQQMTFYMEALASDATRLIPLLQNNGQAMRELGDAAFDAGNVLSEEMIAAAVELDRELAAMSKTLQTQATKAVLEHKEEIGLLVDFITLTLIPVLGGLVTTLGTVALGWKTIAQEARAAILPITRALELSDQGPGATESGNVLPDAPGGFGDDSGDPSLTGTGYVDANGNWVEYGAGGDTPVLPGITAPSLPMTGGSPLDPTGGLLPPVSPLAAARAAWGGGEDESGGGGGSKLAALGLTDEDFEKLEEAFATESELIADAQAAQLAELQAFKDAGIGTEEEYNDLEKRIKEKHNADMAALDRAAMQSKLRAFGGMFGDLSSLMQSENKKLFAVGKAAAIAQAVVQGISSASSAWDKGMLAAGPPGAIAFSAASIAKTGMMISQLRSASSSGGGGGSASTGGRATSVPSGGGSSGGGASEQQAATTFSFTLQNDPMGFGEGFARQMIEQLNKTQANGGQIRAVLNT